MTFSIKRSLCRALLSFAAVFATLTLPATAATIYVPSTATPTIQSGIDAASNGDTVLVGPGTYYENIDFKGKAITITSSGGAASTTINGGRIAPTVSFTNGEARTSTLSNLTITGGQGIYGGKLGGVFIENSSPTIISNIITGNQCYDVNSQYSSPLIQSNEISYTQAVAYECGFASGAGIYIVGDAMTIPNQIKPSSLLPEIVGNIIEQNTQSGREDGGDQGGAGIAVDFGTPVIASNTIRYNATQGLGGGIYFQDDGGLVINNLIYGNTSSSDGGGVYLYEINPGAHLTLTLANNTIVDNAIAPVGSTVGTGAEQMHYTGGLNNASEAGLILVNNIIGGSTTNPSITCDYDTSDPENHLSVSYSHNNFYNNVGAVTGSYGGSSCSLPAGTYGNISVDPDFVSDSSQNYHLLISSSGVDTGDNAAVKAATALGFVDTTDLDGTTRIQDATGNGCTIDMGAYEYPGTATACSSATETLQSSLNPSLFGQSVTFMATVTSANSAPTGLITFTDGTTTLGTANLVNGIATYTTSTLAIGTHPITAAYNPTGTTFNASTAALSQVVNGIGSTTSLTVIPTSADFGTTVQMSAAVVSTGAPITGGTITFKDGATSLSTSTITAAAPSASFNISTLAVGNHSITAAYSGDATHSISTSTVVPVTITADPTSLLLVSSSNPALALQPFALVASLDNLIMTGVPGESITFFANGSPVGTAVTNTRGAASLILSLPAGSYNLTASFAGNAGLAAATSPTVVETVNPNPTTAAVYAQPNPGYQEGNETVTASITTMFAAGPPPVPTGTVTFFDAGAPIATANLDAKGQAAFSTTAFTVGMHTLTAVYNGTANFLTSTSRPYTLAILPSDFTLTADPTITIQTQHHKNINVTLSSIGNFADTIALNCGNLPLYASCNFVNQTPGLATGAALAFTIDIDTDAVHNFEADLVRPTDKPENKPAGTRLREAIAFALLFPVTLLATRRRRRSLRFFITLAAFTLAATLTGCSGHYPGHTAPGTYTITLTGHGAATHVTHTATVTLIVTK